MLMMNLLVLLLVFFFQLDELSGTLDDLESASTDLFTLNLENAVNQEASTKAWAEQRRIDNEQSQSIASLAVLISDFKAKLFDVSSIHVDVVILLLVRLFLLSKPAHRRDTFSTNNHRAMFTFPFISSTSRRDLI